MPLITLAIGSLGLFVTLFPRFIHRERSEVIAHQEGRVRDRSSLLRTSEETAADSLKREKLFSIRRAPSGKTNEEETKERSIPQWPSAPSIVRERLSTEDAFPPDMTVPMRSLDTLTSLRQPDQYP